MAHMILIGQMLKFCIKKENDNKRLEADIFFFIKNEGEKSLNRMTDISNFNNSCNSIIKILL